MIQSIVEGDGEVAALPVLLRRLLPEIGISIGVGAPIKRHRSDFVQERRFKLALQIAGSKPDVDAILILFDADDDCARDCIPNLQLWASQEIAHMPCGFVMARREYEAWFLASLVSLRGQRRISHEAYYAADPEIKRGAKESLCQFMPRNLPYSETADQPALSAVFDMAQAYQRCSSFRKLVKELSRISTKIGQQPIVPQHWLGL